MKASSRVLAPRFSTSLAVTPLAVSVCSACSAIYGAKRWNCSASALLTQHTSAIKRPVVEWRKAGALRHTSVGFDTGQWAQRAAELQG